MVKIKESISGLDDLTRYGGKYAERGEFRDYSSEVVHGNYTDLSVTPGYLRFNGETPVLDNYVIDTQNNMMMVDDHNHALAGWTAALYEGLFDSKPVLIHVDYHEDGGNPPQQFNEELPLTIESLEEQTHLIEIDEFIEAGKKWDLFDEVIEVGVQSTETTISEDIDQMNQALNKYEAAIMDVDLDVYNIHNLEKGFDHQIAQGISNADFTTFATSPGYVLNQEEAIEKIGKLVELSKDL